MDARAAATAARWLPQGCTGAVSEPVCVAMRCTRRGLLVWSLTALAYGCACKQARGGAAQQAGLMVQGRRRGIALRAHNIPPSTHPQPQQPPAMSGLAMLEGPHCMHRDCRLKGGSVAVCSERMLYGMYNVNLTFLKRMVWITHCLSVHLAWRAVDRHPRGAAGRAGAAAQEAASFARVQCVQAPAGSAKCVLPSRL